VFRLGRKKKAKVEPKTLIVKVKDDVVPKVNSAYHQAMERSAPARAEAKARSSAAWHALKGDYQIVTPEKKRSKARGTAVGAAGAVAAAAGAAWAAARRNRTYDWVGEHSNEAAPTSTSLSTDKPARTSMHGSRPKSDDEAGASPDEVIADMAETSQDGATRRH
jgi:hypothetical protein